MTHTETPAVPTDSDAAASGVGAITVRYFAAAKAAAGVTEERIGLPGPTTLGGLLDQLRDRHPAEFATVLERCSFLVDEISARPDTPVAGGAIVDILPPFAGG